MCPAPQSTTLAHLAGDTQGVFVCVFSEFFVAGSKHLKIRQHFSKLFQIYTEAAQYLRYNSPVKNLSMWPSFKLTFNVKLNDLKYTTTGHET